MRIFGLVGVLVALLIVGLLVRKQIAPVTPTTPAATVHEHSQQVQKQYKEAIDAAMQQPRKMPEE